MRASCERRGDAPPPPVVPELMGAAEALGVGGRGDGRARREGVGSAPPCPPACRSSRSRSRAPPGSQGTLRAAVGAAARARSWSTSSRMGRTRSWPGTTGSGKSEFLLAWLTALARAYPPDRVAFLLVDFKGGAAFEPIRDLPHVTGIVTDLDEAEAERAVLSLRAELRHRERVLRAGRCRDIVELDAAVELARAWSSSSTSSRR